MSSTSDKSSETKMPKTPILKSTDAKFPPDAPMKHFSLYDERLPTEETMCRFGANCPHKNDICEYMHPSQ